MRIMNILEGAAFFGTGRGRGKQDLKSGNNTANSRTGGTGGSAKESSVDVRRSSAARKGKGEIALESNKPVIGRHKKVRGKFGKEWAVDNRASRA